METAKRARQLLLGSLITAAVESTGRGVGGRSTFKDEKTVHTSRTLYLCSVPSHVPVEDLEAPFKACPGFIALRRVRGMAFVDYGSKQEATNAITKLQGHKYGERHTGLLISYDKDDTEEVGGSSRRRIAELQRAKESLEATYKRHYCAACGQYCTKLTVSIDELPTRRTDNSKVCSQSNLVTLDMAKGATRAIKREKGVEKQYRMNCMACDVPLAYRSVPFGKTGKFLYLLADAVSTKRKFGGTIPSAPLTRAGDWECPGCASACFASKDTCFNCGAKKTEDTIVLKRQPQRPGDWICPTCDANVFASKSQCFHCKTPKPEGLGDVGGAKKRGAGVCFDWQQGTCARGEACRFEHKAPVGAQRGPAKRREAPRPGSALYVAAEAKAAAAAATKGSGRTEALPNEMSIPQTHALS